MKQSTAVIYRSYGIPEEVLCLDTINLSDPPQGHILVKVLLSVIHPSDIGMIEGSYGKLRDLPAIAGREGIGEVVAIGADVQNCAVGDRVRIPDDVGAWQTMAVFSADKVWRIPVDIPLELAAMSFINPPTAWRMLRDAHLQEGDWVVQNAANSAVGQFVIQMAPTLGLKTLNVVRREDCVAPLLAMGADVVVTEGSGYEKKIADLTGRGRVMLALNSVGGESALRLVKTLSQGGRHVTFGAMSFESVRFPTRQLIFNQLEMVGFWMDAWYRQNSRERIQIMMERLFDLMRTGKLTAPVAEIYELNDFAAAVQASRQPRLGKVLMRCAKQ